MSYAQCGNLGLVFLGFGAMKFFPDVNPAQELAVRTVEAPSLGVVSDANALLLTALAECCIGVTLISGACCAPGWLC